MASDSFVTLSPKPSESGRLYRRAAILALITIVYNIAEGFFSVWFGWEDETFTLFGFGLDSFVEVISGAGVWHMIGRIQRSGAANPDVFERRALRITGTAFYLLAGGLLLTAAVNLILGSKPETTFWGMVISIISIICMGFLIHAKREVGMALNSAAILADAACSKTCLYLSIVLLIASLGYAVTGIGGIDALGAAGIAVFSWREGREAFEKARGGTCSCSGACQGAA